MSPVTVSASPARSTVTPVTAVPSALVSNRTASESIHSSTLGCSIAGRTPSTSASDLAWTMHGKPSQLLQRMHALNGMFCSSSITPQGAWNGWWPCAAKSSASFWMRGSWLTAGNGYGALAGGSVGSSPRAPCTW